MWIRQSLSAMDPGLSSRLTNIVGLPIVHSQSYVCGLPPKHRFQMKKFRGVFDSLVKDKIIDPKRQVLEPSQVSASIAELAHSSDYVNRFFNGETTRDEQRRTGFQWTPGLASRVRFETGGTILGSLASLERGLASSTGGGTHHAGPDYGSGYCLINDLAVTANYLIQLGYVDKILIVDLDVHQGDGTALIFESEPRVFTFSMHCESNFPFRKQTSDLDVGLADGLGDGEYMEVLQSHLPSLLERFRPDLVLYDAGVDPHRDDDLGKLNLTDEGLYKRDEFVISEALSRGIPCCTVIGGGYDKDLEVLSRRHSIIHRVASDVYRRKGL